MRNVSDKLCRENKNPFLCHKFLFENPAVYKVLWKNIRIVRQATNDNIIKWMRFACQITKATDTQHMKYVLLFHGKNVYANAAECCITCTFLFLFCFT